MNATVRVTIVILALAFAATNVPVWAHGDEPHGKEEIVQEVSGSTRLQASSRAEVEAEVVEASNTPYGVLTMLHPATVHFPIALLLLAAVLEGALLVRPRSELEPTIRIVLYFAAGGTIIAVLFGWIHTGMWMGGEALMQRHRWGGTGLAILSLVLAWLASRPADRGRSALRACLAVAAIAVILQGYWGAELSHGPGHLSARH